jgi:NADPH:quinone reductase-like Zn-dependent oxidoreductase
MMRAVQYDRAGGSEVLQVRTVAVPTAATGQVVVRVHATSINPADVISRQSRYPRFPRGTGMDFTGEVVEVGPGVNDLHSGQRVWGYLGGLSGLRRTGAAADFLVAKRDRIAAAPTTVDLVATAALPTVGLTALQALRDALHLQPGQRLLVIGASGGVGSTAVQLGKAMGAHVTAVASARNTDFCLQLGADQVLDYTETMPDTSKREFDALLACHGASLRRYHQLVRPGGRAATLPADTFPFALRSWLLPGPRVRFVYAWPRHRDLEALAGYVDRGELKPIIEHTHPLNAVQDAHRAVESGHTRGKHVIALVQ